MSIEVPLPAEGYSAEVQLHATVNGQELPLTHVGPSQIIFRHPVQLDPGVIAIHIAVDGHVRSYEAKITEPVATGSVRVPVAFSSRSYPR